MVVQAFSRGLVEVQLENPKVLSLNEYYVPCKRSPLFSSRTLLDQNYLATQNSNWDYFFLPLLCLNALQFCWSSFSNFSAVT
jgi:hypothetical protein